MRPYPCWTIPRRPYGPDSASNPVLPVWWPFGLGRRLEVRLYAGVGHRARLALLSGGRTRNKQNECRGKDLHRFSPALAPWRMFYLVGLVCNGGRRFTAWNRGGYAGSRTPFRIFASNEIVFRYRMYANECPAVSGANPDNSCRQRQAYAKGGGNRRGECEQQIFFGLYLVEFRHGLLHQSESQKAVSGTKR
jgi:hypothetical protein